MTLAEVQKLLNAISYTSQDLLGTSVDSACGADLLSDVLAFTCENTLLLTGLIHPQVIRTAEMLDLGGVVFVRGKEPSQEIIDLAVDKGIPVFSTSLPMFVACGILYREGLRGHGMPENRN